MWSTTAKRLLRERLMGTVQWGVGGGIGERENGARVCATGMEKNCEFAINRRGRPVDFREKNFIAMIIILLNIVITIGLSAATVARRVDLRHGRVATRRVARASDRWRGVRRDNAERKRDAPRTPADGRIKKLVAARAVPFSIHRRRHDALGSFNEGIRKCDARAAFTYGCITVQLATPACWWHDRTSPPPLEKG